MEETYIRETCKTLLSSRKICALVILTLLIKNSSQGKKKYNGKVFDDSDESEENTIEEMVALTQANEGECYGDSCNLVTYDFKEEDEDKPADSKSSNSDSSEEDNDLMLLDDEDDNAILVHKGN